MRLKAVVAAFVLVAGIALLYQAGRWLETRNAKPETRGDYTQRYAYGETIEVDGVAYRRKANLTAILLMGVQIDHYVAMNLDGISVLNDWAGGITVTLEDDFSALDPAMTAGKTLTLTGGQAEIYVRSRMSVGVGTNEARMKRQENYISQLTERLNDKFSEGEEEIGALYDALEPYLTTDMSRGRVINMLWDAREYTRTALLEPEGNHEIGSDGFMEFHADDDALKALVLELFYTKVQ